MNPNFNPFPELETERLFLRRIGMEDTPEIYAMRADEDLMKYIDRPRAQSEEDARVLIEKIDTAINMNDGISWGIVPKYTKRVMGTLGLWRLDKENYRAEIGYMLHESLQGQGLMQEALMAILHYGFTEMNVHSVEANVNTGNEASAKLLKKLGFRLEAHFRENYYYDGQFLDSHIYCLLVSDFKSL